MLVVTFGDSVLDCGRYNDHGVTPAGLLVRNDDRLFPEFRGRDLSSHTAARLEHRARDGATIADLPAQGADWQPTEPALTIVSAGGNDLARALLGGQRPDLDALAAALDAFLTRLPVRPVLLCNVYDPSFGDDRRNFLNVPPAIARAAHAGFNARLAELAARHGTLIDLHAHFLTGDPTWLTQTIEPSLLGASEIRRCLLPPALAALPDLVDR